METPPGYRWIEQHGTLHLVSIRSVPQARSLEWVEPEPVARPKVVVEKPPPPPARREPTDRELREAEKWRRNQEEHRALCENAPRLFFEPEQDAGEPMEAALCCQECGRDSDEPICRRCVVAAAGPDREVEASPDEWKLWYIPMGDAFYRQKRWVGEPNAHGYYSQPGMSDHTPTMEQRIRD